MARDQALELLHVIAHPPLIPQILGCYRLAGYLDTPLSTSRDVAYN